MRNILKLFLVLPLMINGCVGAYNVITDFDVNVPGNFENFAAVGEVLSGKRKVASAAWWGFDKEDSTFALQSAINSGASKVIVPYMGSDWIVHPIKLVSNQEIYFEPGVVVVAKRGEYKNTGDCLLNAHKKNNIKIYGYNTTLKMQKQDYIGSEYKKSEWRMGISLLGCQDITIEGLTIKSTGGDGLYINEFERTGASKNIRVKNCVFDNNYRQGISVISVDGLMIDNCIFRNTSGTPPSAGIDIEPNYEGNKASNIVVSNCKSENNDGAGFVVSLRNLDHSSAPISILFYNNSIINCKWGLLVGSNSISGPQGLVEFRNCIVDNTSADGIRVEVDTRAFGINFINCKIKNAANNSLESPVAVRVKRYNENRSDPAPILLQNVGVYDNKQRHAFKFRSWPYEVSSQNLNIKGAVYIYNKHATKTDFGLDRNNTNIDMMYFE